jgi:hypothetical protein
MAMVRLSGQSWWLALYRDGRQRAEYETLVDTVLTPLGRGRTSRWEEIQKDGMVSLRLLCPNGQIGELWGEAHHFFQLKVAVTSVGSVRHHALAHLIGVVDTPDGSCRCSVWEPAKGCLLAFQDNIYHMAYQNIGAIGTEVQGLRV